MPTIETLSATYSFIKPMLADPVLAQEGSNALPLFAVALHLDIEDLATFITESLTDHPADKKADIIYINEADGVACVAQGVTMQDWGKQSAPANKASDLNTAAAWLLQAPIENIPNAIRAHAKLLRDGLAKATITRLIFAYAHNALESKNVEDELQAVRHLLSGLPLAKDTNVEVVELGLRRIEDLYLTSLGSIQVNEKIALPADQVVLQHGMGWTAYVLPLNGKVIYDLYEKHGNALFSANLRDFLGARKVSGNVNNRIKTTAEETPSQFFILNNGLTVVTKRADHDTKARILHIFGVSIVNGAQTTGAIHAAGAEHSKNVAVLARVITVNSAQMISAVVAGNNTQNSIVAWDRRSNDPVQVRLRNEFAARKVEYVHRRDNTRKPKTSLFAEQVGQMLCAFKGDLQTAIRAKADIFESDVTYSKVFPNALSIGHVFAVQTLGWAYDRIKSELKAKSNSGNMTEMETKQLRLLDFPASKQFLICVAGSLREEIAGGKVSEPNAFEIKEDSINSVAQEVVDGWTVVLKAILPIMVIDLPAEDYEVVRSTDHTETVSKRVRGLVTGLEVFQSSFAGIRTLIKPIAY